MMSRSTSTWTACRPWSPTNDGPAAGPDPGTGPAPLADLTEWEGFAAFAEAQKPKPPKRLTLKAYRSLDDVDRMVYDMQRGEVHNNLGPFQLSASKQVTDDGLKLLRRNAQVNPGRARQGLAIDGYPALGKTTTLTTLGREWHRVQRALYPGAKMANGVTDHIPVCYVSLNGDDTIKSVNSAFAAYYGIPPTADDKVKRESARVAHHMRQCGTSLVLIDELHFLMTTTARSMALTNHLKGLMSTVPATFMVAGIELLEAGFFGDPQRNSVANSSALQTGTRFGRYEIGRLDRTVPRAQAEWIALLKAFSSKLVLAAPPQLIDTATAGYIYQRTGGSIGAVAELIRAGAHTVVELEADSSVSHPVLDRSVLDEIKLSHSSEVDARRAPDMRTVSEQRAKERKQARARAKRHKNKGKKAAA